MLLFWGEDLVQFYNDAFRPCLGESIPPLPEMDGYDLLRHFRAQPTTKDVPAIALTAYARPDDVAKAKSAGFQEHLAKPLDPV